MLSRSDRAFLRGLRRAKGRRSSGSFLVEGVRAIGEALDAVEATADGADLEWAVISSRVKDTEAGARLVERLRTTARVEEVPAREIESLSATMTPQGAIAVFREPKAELGRVDPARLCPALVLDGVQDPGNVGTLIRSAVAFGASGVLVTEGSADPFGPKTVRAAAGMVLRLPIVRVTAEEVGVWAGGQGIALWIADSGGDAVGETCPDRPWALVVGSEAHGARTVLFDLAARVVRVPMVGPAESLNAAVAGSILLYELTTMVRSEATS